MNGMSVVTIPITVPKRVAEQGDLVLVSRREYERLVQKQKQPKATFLGYEEMKWQGKKHKVPSYQLHGKAAERLDHRVREGLKEYHEGKTIRASSIAEAVKKYARKKDSKN